MNIKYSVAKDFITASNDPLREWLWDNHPELVWEYQTASGAIPTLKSLFQGYGPITETNWKVPLIKAYRNNTGSSLQEGKAFVESQFSSYEDVIEKLKITPQREKGAYICL